MFSHKGPLDVFKNKTIKVSSGEHLNSKMAAKLEIQAERSVGGFHEDFLIDK